MSFLIELKIAEKFIHSEANAVNFVILGFFSCAKMKYNVLQIFKTDDMISFDISTNIICFTKCQRDHGIIDYGFYRAMLCIRGTSHGPVSVRLPVRHKSVFC